MSTHMPGFQSFSAFLHHFVLARLATGSIRVNENVTDALILTLSLSIFLLFCIDYAINI